MTLFKKQNTLELLFHQSDYVLLSHGLLLNRKRTGGIFKHVPSTTFVTLSHFCLMRCHRRPKCFVMARCTHSRHRIELNEPRNPLEFNNVAGVRHYTDPDNLISISDNGCQKLIVIGDNGSIPLHISLYALIVSLIQDDHSYTIYYCQICWGCLLCSCFAHTLAQKSVRMIRNGKINC